MGKMIVRGRGLVEIKDGKEIAIPPILRDDKVQQGEPYRGGRRISLSDARYAARHGGRHEYPPPASSLPPQTQASHRDSSQ